MNRYWELLCVACTHDLDDKLSLSLVEPLANQALALCQMDLRESTTYQPPKSTATQSQICRFMQEAIQAQFHLMRISGEKIDLDRVEKALRLAGQQLDFFLKCHQWQAQVHATILMPAHLLLDREALESAPQLSELESRQSDLSSSQLSSSQLSSSQLPSSQLSSSQLVDEQLLAEQLLAEQLRAGQRQNGKSESVSAESLLEEYPFEDTPLKIVCVGHPHIYLLSGESFDLKPLLPSSTQPRRGFGEHYPFTLEVATLDIPRMVRLLIGNPNWQQVRPSLVQKIFREPFLNLIPLLLSLIPGGELDHHPFFIVQVSEPAGFLSRLYSKVAQSTKHLVNRLFQHSKGAKV